MRQLSNFWEYVLNTGVTEELTSQTRQRVRLLNGIGFIALVTNCLYLIVIVLTDTRELLVSNLSSVPLFFSPLLLNRLRLYKIAIWFFLISIGIVFGLRTIIMGLGSGQQFVLFICGVLPAMFFRRKWEIYPLFLFHLSIFIFVNLYLKIHPPISPYEEPTFFLANMISIFVVLFMYVRYFQTENMRFQKDLEIQNKKLDLANQDLRQFYYAMAHDLRSPVRGIFHLLEFAEEDHDDLMSPELRKHFKLIRSQLSRMENLTRGILEYSAAADKKELKEVPLLEFLERIRREVQTKSSHKIILEPELPERPVIPALIPQVFLHLVDNAVQFHHGEAGTIRIGCDPFPGGWEFYVSDDGPGIPPQFHQRIFRLFETLSPKSSSGKAGVGLAISRKIVEAHGGRIRLESNGKEGSTFYFTVQSGKTSLNGG